MAESDAGRPAPEPKITNDRATVERVQALLNTGVDPGADPDEEKRNAMSNEETSETETERTQTAAAESAETQEREAQPEQGEDTDDTTDAAAAGEEPAGGDATTKTLQEYLAAQGVEVKPEELYQLMIPMAGDREAVSLSALKDAYAPAVEVRERTTKLDTRERDMEDRQSAYERGQFKDRQEMAMLLSVVREENIPPNVIEHLQAEQRRHQRDARAALLQAFPEFEDRAKYVAFTEQAGAMLGKDYGYRPSELANVTDVRLFRWARDTLRLKERVEKAEKALEEARKELRKAKRARTPQARAAANGAQRGSSQPNALTREREVSRQANQLMNRGRS